MTSSPTWGEKTAGSVVAKTFADKIKGRNVVITGVAPKGIGQSTASAIAAQGPAHLILASRTKEKLEQSAAELRSAHPDVDIQTVSLDLASQASVREAAAAIARLVPTLDLLINNAGAVVMNRQLTAEGIELQFGANHIGHFLFTQQLMPLLEAAAARDGGSGATRIVNLSSQGHRCSPVRFHDINIEGKEVPEEEKMPSYMPPTFTRKNEDGYMPIAAYGQSKSANILFTVGLQKRLKSRGIASFAVHPGSMDTHLGRDHDPEMAEAISKTATYWKSLDEGSATTLVAALDPALNDSNEPYLSDCQFAEPAAWAKDAEAAEKLWKLSEELIGEKFD
ncbi:Short-chain dehydrogenase/reductase SDR [Apiospora saccharicola]|uniref:Short-chain dehydrogenase/reductase SDR n=1 Tax=Apiospora saccharicola TaxID=335842 RepID=A0ABR1UNZ6_9PEZI